MADVFGNKHLTSLVDQIKSRHLIARSHVKQPMYRSREFLNHLIKPEHREVLKQAEEVVGNLQSHTYTNFNFKTRKGVIKRMTLYFKSIDKLLPKYVSNDVIPDDPYFDPMQDWYEQRMEWKDKFTEVIQVLRYMNGHAGSIAGAKLYFHGLTALMEKVEGLEKRTDLTREVRVPSRMPAIPPNMRQAGIRATQTLALASLYTEAVDPPTTYLACSDDDIH